jgi:hypothetical protein
LFSEAAIMKESALLGIDLGKHSFHLHGQDKSGREVFRKKCSRPQISLTALLQQLARALLLPE